MRGPALKRKITEKLATWADASNKTLLVTGARQIGEGVVSDEYAWRSSADAERGAQVDLIIDRKDDLIELCEMKYCRGEFEIDAEYAAKLRNKAEAYRSEHPSVKKAIHVVMVTLNGVVHNSYFREVVSAEVDGDALFG